MNAPKEERIILAFKLQSKLNPDQGDIRPIAEMIDGKLVELNSNNFCHTNKVFVRKDYQLIEKFKEGEIFRITVILADYISTNIDPFAASKYLTLGSKAEKLKPSELIEVIETELPNRNYRYFENLFCPGTEYIFIRNKQEESFGLFSWEKDNDLRFSLELLNDKPILKSYKLNLGQILKATKTTDHLTSCLVENKRRYFILNIHEFLENYEYYEYASDEEIVRYCAKLACEMGTSLFNKTNWDSFKKLAATHPKFNQDLSKNRLIHLSELAVNITFEQEEIKNHIEIFLKGDYGQQLITHFIEQKRPQLLEPLRKEILAEKDREITEKEEKFSQIEMRLKEKLKELQDLSADVERKRKEANQDVILESAVAERNDAVKELEFQIFAKEKQLNELVEKHLLLNNLDKIKEEIEFYEKSYEKQLKKNAGLEATTKKLQNEYNTAEDELRAKLILYKPYVEAINGSFVSDQRERKNVFVKLNHLLDESTDSFHHQQQVVETVKYHLETKGRYFESWQIANLLISTQQSFIVFLAGLPGVGKTSLARLIAETQNLQPRLQEISVARGWTSQKDLIGFYNPLSNRFQSANTGLYTFIEALNFEKDEQAMAYVVLDEANLSPIEHYWSAFMAMADGEGERVLRLGQDTLAIPTTLRFLATINYDGTTEPLSQRVVDRAPVLVMESVPLEKNDVPQDKLIELPLSAIEMNTLFGLAQDIPPFLNEEKLIFDKVRKILSDASLEKGRPLSISQRKEIIIRQYCDKARYLMGAFGCDDFKALDLAVLQHVLPQVRGNGEKFARRLTELKQLSDDVGLKDSAKYLEKMLAYGETELHSYDFFCW